MVQPPKNTPPSEDRSPLGTNISLEGVRQNNLKNFNLEIPLGKLTVITGVSGSGKSSLAFDTLYAEGSRRYMESLSTYARQFLEKMPRPEVDAITNVPPALALEQRNSIVNNRTTLAAMTEIYDYLRLLFASLGSQNCRACGHHDVSFQDSSSHLTRILKLPEGTRFYLLAPVAEEDPPALPEKKKSKKKPAPKEAGSIPMGQSLFQKGYQRIFYRGEVIDLSSPEGQTFSPLDDTPPYALVDRFVRNESLAEDPSRLSDSLEQALLMGNGSARVHLLDGGEALTLTSGYSCTKCGTIHTPPSPPLFSSNSPLGACPTCSGFGEILELDEELIVPDKAKALRDGAVDPFSKPSYLDWQKELLKALEKRGVPGYTRYSDLKDSDREFLWQGGNGFAGINGYFEELKGWKYKLHVRVFIRRYQSLRLCPSCKGSRLSPEPLRFQISGKNLGDVLDFSISEAIAWIKALPLNPSDRKKVREVLRQVDERLSFLEGVGVGYLKLNRKGNSLSGGEYQRTSLASQLGSKLSNTLYVLDEPSIGLHPEDTDRLIGVIHRLRDHGNTLVVVEHDAKVMKSADYLVEIGPKAGADGGHLVTALQRDEFLEDKKSLTARYLSGDLCLPKPRPRKDPTKWIEIKGCQQHNLKNVDLRIPIGCVTAITGLSGSGKSTLIHDTLYKSLARLVLREPVPSHEVGAYRELKGWENLGGLLLLDQTPIGRSSRSNTATYLKFYDEVRKLLASQPTAARRHLSPASFSFNVDGGRCPVCKGEGTIEVDMHFMAAIQLVCDECQGKRFQKHVLEVEYKGKNVDQILHTTVSEAKVLFADSNTIVHRCELLEQVGLGYLQLGQSISTLSGGECQRLKIASTLAEQGNSAQSVLYIFDEPTTGLHVHDIKNLISVFHRLVDSGHTVVFIEHHMDLVAQADWVVDLGPGGGSGGGKIMAEGTPEKVAGATKSITAKHLRQALDLHL
jgi:excinuclease ABC subunit A